MTGRVVRLALFPAPDRHTIVLRIPADFMSPYLLSAVANALTFIRLPLAALLWIAPHNDAFLLSIMVAAAITDMLDGLLARRAQALALASGKGSLDRAARIGSWLDPLCDKTFVISVLGAVYVAEPSSLHLLLLVAAREFILIPASLLWQVLATPYDRRHVFFSAGPLGKATTVTQFLAVGAIILELRYEVRLAGAGLAAALGVLAASQYLARARRSVRAAREGR